jgi:spectinomycin phosphotransferase
LCGYIAASKITESNSPAAYACRNAGAVGRYGRQVREPPPDVDADDLLAVVRSEWDRTIERLEHLPLGFGAHHWAAYGVAQPVLFVTLDRLDATRSAADLGAAYSAAVALYEAGLDFVLAPLPSTGGSPIVRFGDGAVSCTPWRSGTSGGELDEAWTRRALARLHAVAPPLGIPRWKPLVAPTFAADVSRRLEQPWGPGPYADRARYAVGEHIADVTRWSNRYHALAQRARTRTWVATHGEPHSDNQLLTPQGRYLLDWESLKLAPRERDLRDLVDAGAPVDADPDMVVMFDLEWRLDEIRQYTAWFAAEHHGTEDDAIAFGGLIEELTRG